MMSALKPTVILRHKKENLKKCSLRGLEPRSDFIFLTYPKSTLPSLKGYVLLTMGAPPLTKEDHDKGIFLIDGTWRYAQVMLSSIPKPYEFELRSIPDNYRTAYPRYQTECSDPEKGLASVEALYIAFQLMGKDPSGLLDHYYWKEDFLRKNSF